MKRGGRKSANPQSTAVFTFHPATPDRWADLELLFGPKGACGGCWCMAWRRSRKEFEAHKGAGNRRGLQALVEAGPPPGVLGYADSNPIGWCSVAPRTAFAVLQNSRILKPVDDRPVWSITCLFVARGFRRRGVSALLIRAAVELPASFGASLVEAYPNEPVKDSAPDVFLWTGLASAFRKAGFQEVARRSPKRPVMRLEV